MWIHPRCGPALFDLFFFFLSYHFVSKKKELTKKNTDRGRGTTIFSGRGDTLWYCGSLHSREGVRVTPFYFCCLVLGKLATYGSSDTASGAVGRQQRAPCFAVPSTLSLYHSEGRKRRERASALSVCLSLCY
jgi:hypothetical protein